MQHWRRWGVLIVLMFIVMAGWQMIAVPASPPVSRAESTPTPPALGASPPAPSPLPPSPPPPLPPPTAVSPTMPVLDVLPPPTPTVVNPARDAVLAALPPFCGQGRDLARSCGLPLAIQLALDLKQHPDQPQALERYRQLMEIPSVARAWDAPPTWKLDVSWAIPAWLRMEMQARYPRPLPYTTLQEAVTIGRVTVLPTDLDGDGSADYLLTTSVAWRQEGAYWFRWQDDQWQLRSQWTYAVEADWAGPRVGDVTGDGQPDLLILDVRCGSACSEGLRALTWRDDHWQRLLPVGAGYAEWDMQPQPDGTLAV